MPIRGLPAYDRFRWLSATAIFLSLTWLPPGVACAESLSGEIEFFEKRIRPVLVEHCYECHSSDSEQVEGRLRLDSRQAVLQGGESGPALVPGDAASSLLIEALRYEGLEMPPQGKLPASVVADFRRWINGGAVDPRDEPGTFDEATVIDFEAAREFWSFQPPQRHVAPAVEGSEWAQTRVDAFILARLEQASLAPAPAANRGMWLRRVTFDLTGLPPTPAAIADFDADDSPGAHRRVVDRLLASPQYGARMARLWLDLARYAEDQAHIVGQDESLLYPNAYLYRDWVITVLNRDLPYDRFVRLQLAADLYEGEDSENIAALGFMGLGPKYYGRRSLQVMSDEWEDRVDIVGRGLLGLTIACARCHDHKFDPIGTEDYYALAGVFASTAMFNRPLHADVETAGSEQDDVKDFENGKKFAGEAKDPKQALHVIREAALTDLNVFIRGNAENRGPLVARHFPRVLSAGEPEPFTGGSGRRELAEAITAPENPLAARVIVNRMWGLFFGQPLVATPSNFGSIGQRPSHPELLDDLAVRFIDAGWSLKWLSRELVLSATYRQTSQTGVITGDAENRLLARMPRRRLTVEQWRDAILAGTGRLDFSIGGPSLDPQDPQERRRTIYSRVSRLELDKLLAMFDYPDPNVHADRRVVTTTPLQKLFVLNSSFMVEQARALALRLCSNEQEGTAPGIESRTAVQRQRIARAYLLLYGRQPTATETQLGLEFLQPKNADAKAPDNRHGSVLQRWRQYAHVLLASSELLYLD